MERKDENREILTLNGTQIKISLIIKYSFQFHVYLSYKATYLKYEVKTSYVSDYRSKYYSYINIMVFKRI